MSTGKEADAEFGAMQTIYSALQQLDEAAQIRVLDYVSSRLEIISKTRPGTKAPVDAPSGESVPPEQQKELIGTMSFGSLAELADAAQPKTQPEKALVCGYWLQVCQGAESFDSFSINKALKNLGEGITNITSALDSLRDQKPALALQLKKSGKSRQARKIFKLTVAGIKIVEDMIRE